MKYVFTIGVTDIGKRSITDIDGRIWSLADSIGFVQPCDVDKRAFDVSGVLQIESDAQRNERIEGSEA